MKLTHRQSSRGLKYLRKSSAAPLQFDWHILISVDCGDQACSVYAACSPSWPISLFTLSPSFPVRQRLMHPPHTPSPRPQKLRVHSIFAHTSTVKTWIHSSWQPAGSPHNHAAPTPANNIIHILLGHTIPKLKLKRWAGGSENVISDKLSHQRGRGLIGVSCDLWPTLWSLISE